MFLVPWCHVAGMEGMEAFKALHVCYYVLCFFNDRLLGTETGERKVDGSG